MPLYDYICECGHQFEDIVGKPEEKVPCPKCNQIAERQNSTATIFKHIIPTYPGSQQRKAGYQHKHLNRAATKTQVGAGGSVSVDNPRTRIRNRD
jgi:putative FmdB family regulatory protein